MPGPIIDKFAAFIGTEREHYVEDDDYRVAFSLGQVRRYLHFVEIIQERYRVVNDKVVERFRQKISDASSNPGIRQLTAEEVVEHEKDAERHAVLHLEIESYFLFAKILLDKVAQFIEDFFGTARGMSLRSHDKWCKSLDAYTQIKKLDVPVGMDEVMHRLRAIIADYRDKQIAHFQNPRAGFGTHISGEGATQIGIDAYFPKEADKSVTSPTTDEASGLIDTYISQLIELIESNRVRSRYKLRSRGEA
jgi:hypothetical protein